MNIREISKGEAGVFEEYCDREWEHNGVVPPVTRQGIETPSPKGTDKLHLFAEVDGEVTAGLTLQFNEKAKRGAYGFRDFLDLWVIKEYRGKIEDEIIEKCDAMMKEMGMEVSFTRIPDYTSRFTQKFKERGYKEMYREDSFIREAGKPLDALTLSYYEKSREKVNLRVSDNLKEDTETYLTLLDEVSKDVLNVQSLERDFLQSELFEGTRSMIGVWVFAEVDTVPAGYIIGTVSFQKLMGKKRIVGSIVNNGVLKKFRGMGIGTALYVKMIEEMRRWKTEYVVDYMVLEENIPERVLLGELGFEIAQSHVKMQKTL